MADETTQTDTGTSETAAPNDAATVEALASTEQQTETDAETTETTDAAKPGDDDGTVLGGDVKEGEEGDKEPEGAPEAYDLKMEGLELDAELVKEAEPILRELNLSNDSANKLLPMAKKLTDTAAENTVKAITDMAAQQRKDWLDIAKKDETIGGAKWDETTALAAKGMDAIGFTADHPFRKALNETGFGNHRDMLFVFRTLGELAGEDGFARGGASETTATQSLVDRMYPDPK